MEAKHTPGPWEAGHYNGTPTIFDSRGNGTIPLATVHDVTTGDPEANARLIAAAPDLLAACEALAQWADKECMPVGETNDGPWDQLDAAIAKAKTTEHAPSAS